MPNNVSGLLAETLQSLIASHLREDNQDNPDTYLLAFNQYTERYNLNPQQLHQTLAKQLALEAVDIDAVPKERIMITATGTHRIIRQHTICFKQPHGVVYAIANPRLIHPINEILKFDSTIYRLVLCEPNRFYALLSQHEHQRFYLRIAQAPRSDDNVIIELTEHLITHANEKKASDLHIEPQASQLCIRARIDGLLQSLTTLPLSFARGLSNRIKVLSKLDITERRLPQDGRFNFAACSHSLDCRVSCCPTQYGEKIVIRLLASQSDILSFDSLGMNQALQNYVIQQTTQPQGLVLVTGPTGSGKTQTLYTVLHHLNAAVNNLSTIEDPIEISLKGINQINIQPDIGLDYARILKALLRQDPDIIMIGEIRDQQTAQIAVRAAQTGHLVLSSLHTNNAVESINRLVNMGVARYNLVNCINLIIAQRLIRLLCSFCKSVAPTLLTERFLESHALSSTLNTLYQPTGCARCQQGFKSRTAIFEITVGSDSLNEYIMQASPVSKKLTKTTLQSSAITQVLSGNTSICEYNRVMGEGYI